MKIILVNGSPRRGGNTNFVLEEIKNRFERLSNEIDIEIFWIGNNPILGCLGCNKCLENKRCFIDDKVNEFLEKLDDAEGVVFASPVHFAGIPGMLSSFLDRAFYIKKDLYKNKVVSSVHIQRRAGACSAIEQMNKYFSMSNTIIATSSYWNMLYGTDVEKIKQDLEGMQTVENLAKNMYYIIECIKMGKINGVKEQEYEKTIKTNFIK